MEWSPIRDMVASAWMQVLPWLSIDLAAVPWIVRSYWLGRRPSPPPSMWLLMGVSNALLCLTGAVSIVQGNKHLGFLAAGWLAVNAILNWWRKRRAAPAPICRPTADGGWAVYHGGRHIATIPPERATQPSIRAVEVGA